MNDPNKNLDILNNLTQALALRALPLVQGAANDELVYHAIIVVVEANRKDHCQIHMASSSTMPDAVTARMLVSEAEYLLSHGSDVVTHYPPKCDA